MLDSTRPPRVPGCLILDLTGLRTQLDHRTFKWGLHMNLPSVFLFLLSILLAGCSTVKTVPIIIPPLDCGATLDPIYLKTCILPDNLPPGSTFLDVLENNAHLRKNLKECSAKNRVLQDTLQACKTAKGNWRMKCYVLTNSTNDFKWKNLWN